MTAASLAALVVIATAIGIVVAARLLGLSLRRHGGVVAMLIITGMVLVFGIPGVLEEFSNRRISPGESWPWCLLAWIAITTVVLRRRAAAEAVRAAQRELDTRRPAEPAIAKSAEPGPGASPAPKPTPSLRLFICYRRSDSQDVAGRLYDRLSRHFGAEHVFKDVDSVPLGVDFRRFVGDQVGRCDVLLAIIGPGWVGARNAQGRRLDDPRDLVRIELASALKRDLPVVPILVGNASLPEEEALPGELRPLSYRNGTPLRPDPDFHSDVDRRIEGLEAARR